MIHITYGLCNMSRKGKFIDIESRSMIAWGWGQEWGVTANGQEGTSWSDRNGLKLDCDNSDGCIPL